MDILPLYSTSKIKCNIITTRKFVVTDSVVCSSIIIEWYKSSILVLQSSVHVVMIDFYNTACAIQHYIYTYT